MSRHMMVRLPLKDESSALQSHIDFHRRPREFNVGSNPFSGLKTNLCRSL